MCLTGVRAGPSALRVVREGLPEEVTFLQSLELLLEVVGTAWWGVEAGGLETQKEAGSRVPGFGAPGMPGGGVGDSETGPGTSVARISHPGEELPAAGP